MLTIAYATTSAPSARELKRCLEQIFGSEKVEIVKRNTADINWGRSGDITSELWDETALNHNIIASTNKLRMRVQFMEHGVPAPLLLEDPETAYAWIAEGKPVLARTRTHTRRKGFYLCRTPQQLDKAILRGCVQFIEYIEDAVREYRVHIFNGLSIRLNQKEWTNDAHTKYTTIPANKELYGAEVKQVRDVAKKAVAACDLDFGAVDVIVAPDGRVLACEVNAAPGLGGTTGMAYAEAIKRWWLE